MANLQIPNHSHCVICSRAVQFGDKTCSPECEHSYADLTKRRKRTMYVMYGLMGLAMLVLLLSYTGLFGPTP